MDRRKFLKTTSFIGLGGLFIPSTLFSSCRKETLFEDSSYSGKVIIIGSGVAGLYAGYILKSKGIDFQILEASSVYGGRLGKLTGFADFPIDKGAQWLHGKNNLLSDFITASNTKITLDDTEAVYWFNNQLVESLPKDPNIFDAENLPDISFQDYAIQKGFGEEYKYIIENIAGDQGAEASVLSAYWNHQEETNWCSGDDDYKFEETFFDFFEKNIISEISDKIKLNTIVSKIDYSSDGHFKHSNYNV
ncbi:MAG: FAD-dependent oxidoreductase [Fluviicola sp.]|nr:FAD-dependent oxidoreductase [Fluviicola sp.]